MRQKLDAGKYASAVDFVKDLKLIWRNCMTYNAVSGWCTQVRSVSCIYLGWFVVLHVGGEVRQEDG